MARLSTHLEDISRCGRCGYCVGAYVADTCPARYLIGFESATAKGRMLIARGMLEGKLHQSSELTERTYTCFLCGACKVKCQDAAGIDTTDIIMAMREYIFDSDTHIPETVRKLGAAVESRHNIIGVSPDRTSAWITDDIRQNKQAELLYFPGCFTSLRLPEIAQATARMLNLLGIDFATLGSEGWCCGSPLLSTGQHSLAREMAMHNVEEIKRRKINTVLVSCPGCYRALSQQYLKLLDLTELPFQIVHTSQFFNRILNEHEIGFKKTLDGIVTYHDPCELGRLSGIYKEPRELIRRVTGAQIVEMVRNRETAWCCGGGGGMMALYPDKSARVANVRLEEAVSTGAKYLVTGCPTCKWNLERTAQDSKIPLKIMDLSELVYSSLI